jgi:hypothetical protein
MELSEEDPVKFLTFMRCPEAYRDSPPSGMMAAMDEFVERLRQAGTLVDNGGLSPSRDGIRVAAEFMEVHRRYWPGFEGEAEVRPIAGK